MANASSCPMYRMMKKEEKRKEKKRKERIDKRRDEKRSNTRITIQPNKFRGHFNANKDLKNQTMTDERLTST
jgi:hypothetical protein